MRLSRKELVLNTNNMSELWDKFFLQKNPVFLLIALIIYNMVSLPTFTNNPLISPPLQKMKILIEELSGLSYFSGTIFILKNKRTELNKKEPKGIKTDSNSGSSNALVRMLHFFLAILPLQKIWISLRLAIQFFPDDFFWPDVFSNSQEGPKEALLMWFADSTLMRWWHGR